jgi:hypothetical protein
MDQLGDVLAYRLPPEPPEITALKRYIFEHYKATAQITIQNDAIIINVSSAALANTLRLRLPQLRDAADTERKLIFRIG